MAKTKLCCGPDGCGEIIETNYDVDEQAWMTERRCAGSKCMAWKWDITLNRELSVSEINRDDYEGWCGLTK